MAVTIAQLNAVLGVNTQEFNSKIKDAESTWQRFQLVVAGAAGGFAAAGISFATDFGQQVVKTMLDVQESMGSIGALTGQTGDALQGLQNVATGAFLHMTQDLKEVAVATAALTDRTHLTGRALQDLLQTEGNVARVTGQDLKSTVDGSTLAMNKWGIASKDMSSEMDVLMGQSQRTFTSFNTLTEDLRRSGSVLQDMGLTFDQSTKLMADLEAKGTNVSQVMFGLRQAAGKLAEAGIPLRDGFIEIVRHLGATSSATKQLAEANVGLGKRTAEELLPRIKDGTLSISNWTDAVTKAGGASAQAARDINPVATSLTEVHHALQMLLTSGGSNFQASFWGEYFHDWALAIRSVEGGLRDLGNYMDKHFSDKATASKASADAQVESDRKEVLSGMNVRSVSGNWHAEYLNFLKERDAATKESEKISIDAWQGMGLASEKAMTQMITAAEEEAKNAAKTDKMLQGKPKAHKLSELERETAEMKKLTDEAQAELTALETGADSTLAKVAGHFRKMSSESINHLANLRQEIHKFTETTKETKEAHAMLEELKIKTEALQHGGELTKEALSSKLPMVDAGLISQINLASKTFNDLDAAEQRHTENINEHNRLDKSAVEATKQMNVEIAKLTHTRTVDIAALQLYGKTFFEIKDTDPVETLKHQQAAISLGDQMDEANRITRMNRELKVEDEQVQSLFKHWDELQLKLAQATPMEEAGRAAREMLTPFDKLPEVRKMVEENAEANKDFGVSFMELDDDMQLFVQAILAWEHALAIKNKTDADNDATNKRSDDLTKKMTDHLAELNQKIRQFSDPSVNKQAKFVTDVIAEQLHLTEEQQKRLQEIIAAEKQLSGLEQHATAMKKLAQTLNQEFTKVFDDLMSGHKNAFASLEKDFEAMLQKMAAKYLASQLSKILMNLFTSLTGGGIPTAGPSGPNHYAAGGNLAPGQLAMVGENGPELFQPSGGGQIIPNNQLGQGRSGGVTVNMTVNAQDANSFRMSQNQLAQQLGAAITRATMRNG